MKGATNDQILTHIYPKKREYMGGDGPVVTYHLSLADIHTIIEMARDKPLPQTAYEMVRNPGIYRLALAPQAFFRVEVDKAGTIFQLNPEGKRDGIMGIAGFHPQTLILAKES